jgi:hypothetical protein
MLRDPIERAISNYWFSVDNGFETLPMSEAFLQEEERWVDYNAEQVSVSPHAYLRRGRYVEQICLYERYFAAEDMKLVLLEQVAESRHMVGEIYSFLGVTSDFVPLGLQRIVNPGKEPRVTPSSALKRYLTEYFVESNAQLAERYGLDLTQWR